MTTPAESDATGVLSLARPEIRNLTPYAHASWAPAHTRLHANELPWPDAANGREPLNRYPEPQPGSLLAALASYFGVRQEQVLATHGSDEAIDLLTRAFCRAGQDSVIVTPPSFGMFAVAARVQGAGVIEVPLQPESNYEFSAAALLAVLDPAVKIVWLCSPNNPTGACLSTTEVMKVLRATRGRALVVLDEAYGEFAVQPCWSQRLGEHPQLVVLRTLSKAHGLAGARIGAVLAQPDVVALLRKIILPYTLSSDSIHRALAALQPAALAVTAARVAALIAARDKLAGAFAKSPVVVKVWPSEANFLLLQVRRDVPLFERWLEAGLLVRDFRRAPGLADCLRVTVGDETQNAAMLRVLGELE
jgi:histidinol-phosphate aminotransferase